MPKTKVTTVFSRAEEYKSEGFYVFDAAKGILMCKYCNVRIKWERKDTCDKHCRESETHKKKKNEASEHNSKRQITIGDTLHIAKKLKSDREQFVIDTTKAFMQANIPLEKLDNPGMREWMNKYIKGAGDLPQANTCRQNYIPLVKAEYEEEVKEAVRNRKLIIHCDETTNRKGEAVFIILFRILPVDALPSKLYVASVKILQNVDSQECCQSINNAIVKYSVDYNDVVGISSDSAPYMTKCVRTLKGLISDDLVHVQCWAHKLDIITKLVPSYFTNLNKCVSMTKKAFKNTRKRKHRYLKFLREKYSRGEKTVKLFPMPVLTRWGSWLDSAVYLQEYLCDLVEYFKESDDVSDAVKYFKDLTSNEQKAVLSEATCAKEHWTSVSQFVTVLEGSHYPTAHKLTPKLDLIIGGFDLVRKLVLDKETTVALNQLSGERKDREERKIKNLAKKCTEKLKKMIEQDPARRIFQATAALFYLPNVLSNEVNSTLMDSVKSIPILASISTNSFFQGYMALQNAAKAHLGEEKKEDLVSEILGGLIEDHSEFASKCLQALWFPTSNVDSERGFSAYTKILSDCRTTLHADNVETMLSLYFGDK